MRLHLLYDKALNSCFKQHLNLIKLHFTLQKIEFLLLFLGSIFIVSLIFKHFTTAEICHLEIRFYHDLTPGN